MNTEESITYLKSLGNDAQYQLDVKDRKPICDIRYIIAREVEDYQQYRLRHDEVRLGDVVHRIGLFKDGAYCPHFYEDEVKLLFKGDGEFTDYYRIPNK